MARYRVLSVVVPLLLYIGEIAAQQLSQPSTAKPLVTTKSYIEIEQVGPIRIISPATTEYTSTTTLLITEDDAKRMAATNPAFRNTWMYKFVTDQNACAHSTSTRAVP